MIVRTARKMRGHLDAFSGLTYTSSFRRVSASRACVPWRGVAVGNRLASDRCESGVGKSVIHGGRSSPVLVMVWVCRP
jgi:hypothetical protein